MTLVAIARNDERLLAFADTFITGPALLTGGGAKLFPLPIAVNSIQDNKEIFRTSFGFAFAGSTLVANSTFALCSSALQILWTESGEVPSLEDVSGFVALAALGYFREIGSSTSQPPNVELSIFGFCPRNSKLGHYRARTTVEDGTPEMQFGEIDCRTGICQLMGSESAKSDFLRIVDENNGGDGAAHILDKIIKSKKHPGVGGSLQVLEADATGARILPTLYRKAGGGGYLRVFGRSIDDFGKLGGCSFGTNAYGIFED